MTCNVPRVSAITLGVAAFVSLSTTFRGIRGFVRGARAYAERARDDRERRARLKRDSAFTQ